MLSRPAIGIGVLAIVCVLAVTGAVAQSGYAISSTDTSPVPERSFDLQGETHTIDSRISATPGEEITVEVAAPDEVYRVYLYNGDEQIVDRQRGEGDGTFTFDLAEYEPGSYAITTHSRETDKHEAVMPLLVEGYDVSVDAPSSTSANESFDVTIDATEVASSGDPASVWAVFTSDGGEHTIQVSGGDGEYTATVAAGELDVGEYTVYGIVQGEDQAFDRNELLGLAEGGTLTVETGSESQEDGAGGDDGAGTGAGEGTATAAETVNGTATATESGIGTATEPADSSDETETATATEPSDNAVATDAQPTTEGGAAITPDDSNTDTQTTEAEGPGFGGVHLAIALGAILGAVVLRQKARSE